ncbi:triose-phosphate isomerase [bacterium]|nr:triose-phosphate isomerase [bacterium]
MLTLAANWKMNTLSGEDASFVKEYASKVPDSPEVRTIILPPFTALPGVASACKESGKDASLLAFGAQNMYLESSGAFTGEISPDMLLDLGCSYVVLGHSERRAIFGETDDLIAKKVAAALKAGLTPIFCIGETLTERESGRLEEVLSRQVKVGLALVKPEDLSKVIIAYEPVWAIGTGVVATPEQAQDAHKFVRGLVEGLTPPSPPPLKQEGKEKEATPPTPPLKQGGNRIPILYGGSVKPDNVVELMIKPDIDGALVGGASLKVDSLLALYEGCVQAAATK